MRKLTTAEFIEKARAVHGNKYDYSETEYKTAHIKVKIICPIHGEFNQTPDNHLHSKGCNMCGNESIKQKQRSDTSIFMEKARLIHDDRYDYSKVEYINNSTKIIIICPVHGKFEQRPDDHLRGKGCPFCANNIKNETIQFKEKAIIKHGDKYDYSKSIYRGARQPVTIICPKHGEFKQIPNNHLCGAGCPLCRTSKGENAIQKYLYSNNIEFEYQKHFNDCRNTRILPFDFYISDKNLLIEFDGKQHIQPVKWFGGHNGFMIRQQNDKKKTEYAKKHNIDLLRISYKDIDNIESILDKKLTGGNHEKRSVGKLSARRHRCRH